MNEDEHKIGDAALSLMDAYIRYYPDVSINLKQVAADCRAAAKILYGQEV